MDNNNNHYSRIDQRSIRFPSRRCYWEYILTSTFSCRKMYLELVEFFEKSRDHRLFFPNRGQNIDTNDGFEFIGHFVGIVSHLRTSTNGCYDDEETVYRATTGVACLFEKLSVRKPLYSEVMEVDPDVALNAASNTTVTEEEFQNFMHRVTQVEKIVGKLASEDPREQDLGTLLADEILNGKVRTESSEVGDLKVKSSRTVINELAQSEETSQGEMSREAFVRTVERDAKQRAEERKVRNERADTYKRIGNSAYKRGDYEKAVTYYTKAVEQRKDSVTLWNNRALSYVKLGLYEKALTDCEWALKVNDENIKALLNGAKCCDRLGKLDKANEFVERAKESHPELIDFIEDFVENAKKNDVPDST